MRRIYLPALLLVLITVNTSIAQEKALRNNLGAISADAIKGSMSFLADDLLEGRQPGTRGFALASKFVETKFMSLGLVPGINGTSYIQKVPLRKGVVNENTSSFSLLIDGKEEVLSYGKHFIISPYFSNESSTVTAPLVFVGYGISAPEFNYDDYRDIDVKGKIVVFINDAPSRFPSNEKAYFTTTDAKFGEAIKRGAVAAISFSLPSNRRTTWEAGVRRSKQGSFKWLDNNSFPHNSSPELKAVVSLNNEYLDKLLVNSGRSTETLYKEVKEEKPISFPLNISAQVKVSTRFTPVEGSNVLGMIPGSDPKLKEECVVYSAHLDHFGIGAPVKNDSIYNGAHDDASGVAILLEIIAAYQRLPHPPKRSILFAVVTGEESGLLGSDYFVNNPTIPATNIVANLAIDMPFFFHPVLDIVPYGADHSSLSKQVEQTTKFLGLQISPDPFPEQVVFIRSDHYSFIKKGIPALFIKSGFMTVPQDTTDRSKSDVAWRSTIYHTPQDDMNQPFDFHAATMHVKVNFLVGYFVANEATRPTWNANDFFGKRFQK